MDENLTPVMKNYKNLPPFKGMVIQQFPFIEEDFDAITNYQLLCKVVEYLKSIYNNNILEQENITSLYNSYLSLLNYVNTYFDNLDVQDEVNEKLDEMASDGSLTNLIKDYVDPIYEAYESEINDDITNFKNVTNNSINTLRNEVESIASGSPLVADSISDMTDTTRTYVLTTDGYWYYYDGTNWTAGGVYQAREIPDYSITSDKIKINGITLDKIDFNNYLFNDYDIVRKLLMGFNTTTYLPSWSQESQDYYSIYFEIPSNIDYIIYPFSDAAPVFSAVGYTPNANAFGFTKSDVISSGYGAFVYDDGYVTVDISRLRRNYTHLAIQLSPLSHDIRLITKDGSDIKIPLTNFIGKDNLKDGSISYEKCDNELKVLINQSLGITTLTVKQNGTGDFTNLNDALSSLVSGKKYKIEIYPGTYNVSDYWTEEQIQSANYPNGFYGEVIPDGCSLIGIGNRDNIIIHAELNSTYDWSSIRSQISTLNVLGDAAIENITVSAKGLRYAIHDDFTEAVNKTHNYINCKIFYYLDRIRHAFGSGARSGLTINIENCEIEPAMGYHTNLGFTSTPVLNIKNTIIKGNIQLTDYNSGIKCPVNFENVKYTRLSYSQFQSTTQYIELKSFNNSLSPVIQTTDFNYEGDEFIPCLAINNITKGQPVKRNAQDGVTPLTSTDNIFDFFGIAVENISKYVYGSSRTFGKIQTKGYITSTMLGLSNLNVNDKIGITNGTIGLVSNDAIGIVDFIVDDIAYIRLY